MQDLTSFGNQKEKYFGFSVSISLRPWTLSSKNKHFYPYYPVCFPVSLKQKKQVPKSQGVTYATAFDHQDDQLDKC